MPRSQAVCMLSLGLWARKGSSEVSSCHSQGPTMQDLPWEANACIQRIPNHRVALRSAQVSLWLSLEPRGSVRGLAARGMPAGAQGPPSTPSLPQLSASGTSCGSALPLQPHAETVSFPCHYFFAFNLNWWVPSEVPTVAMGRARLPHPIPQTTMPAQPPRASPRGFASSTGHRGLWCGGLMAAGAWRLFKTGPAPSLPSSLFQLGRAVFWQQ